MYSVDYPDTRTNIVFGVEAEISYHNLLMLLILYILSTYLMHIKQPAT